MSDELNVDREHEIIGMRLTVYHLLPYFLDPAVTEAYICQLYDLTPEQVARARAYVLRNPEKVLARHLQIEARNAAGNLPEVVEKGRHVHEVFERFKTWLANRPREETAADVESVRNGGANGSAAIPTFHEWMMQQEATAAKGP